ncbi:amino acid lyase [Neisseria arctica]|uniref:Amino acid lyase n=1 Tax=Neisseria arctica TaxID=1470200 RepID=A0A0J0YU20_9NEIS|nr:aminotransferase class I/II-fold pyridoxal phosphate-dependent enzyme [Neisseria arctica]KLT73609.1 amino acid lyase [Neisseria arctica]UOO85731.1 aminotransferase class V-fold PLP-dependent enzyme [Neisseria arctica]
MYNFKNDYAEGAHPNILNRLLVSNLEQHEGYGADFYSIKAKEILRGLIQNESAAIHFLSGGTQTNRLAMTAFLRPHEAVISPSSGHIATNEAGAIEASGHKVITAPAEHGKLTVSAIEAVVKNHSLAPHVVKPKLVYISQATEVGTVYNLAELEALSNYCRNHGLYFYIDGARLGSAIMAEGCDVTLPDLARLTDAFYIGATKNGGLLGEAMVIANPDLQNDFDYIVKQNGALLSKGRLLGIQYFELFSDGLYFELARHANTMAAKITAALRGKGYNFLTDSTTNQIFPILPYSLIEKLKSDFDFYIWQAIDNNHAAIRLITSWATPESAVDQFIAALE